VIALALDGRNATVTVTVTVTVTDDIEQVLGRPATDFVDYAAAAAAAGAWNLPAGVMA
jgi:hypothetical protein